MPLFCSVSLSCPNVPQLASDVKLLCGLPSSDNEPSVNSAILAHTIPAHQDPVKPTPKGAGSRRGQAYVLTVSTRNGRKLYTQLSTRFRGISDPLVNHLYTYPQKTRDQHPPARLLLGVGVGPGRQDNRAAPPALPPSKPGALRAGAPSSSTQSAGHKPHGRLPEPLSHARGARLACIACNGHG
jgi:hypothetical protein